MRTQRENTSVCDHFFLKCAASPGQLSSYSVHLKLSGPLIPAWVQFVCFIQGTTHVLSGKRRCRRRVRGLGAPRGPLLCRLSMNLETRTCESAHSCSILPTMSSQAASRHSGSPATLEVLGPP